MASEFDKEMDFLLRQAARQNSSALENVAENHLPSVLDNLSINHLDADDLAAFAENTLPQFARSSFVSHLADCNSCRDILSNLILLNEAAQEEDAAITREPEKATAATERNWLDSFKKFFALPTLGYATAALAVLLIGSFAFVALRRTQENRADSVAQIEPEQTEAVTKKRASAPPPAPARDEENQQKVEIPSETPNTNTAETPPENEPMLEERDGDNLPPSVRATKGLSRNSATANVAARNEISANSSSQNAPATSATPKQQTAQPITGGALAAKPEESESQLTQSPAPKPEDKVKTELLARSSGSVDKDEKAKTDDDSRDSVGTAPPMGERRAATSSNNIESRKNAAETRTIGGKTFQKIGGVWFDSAYNSQNPKSISRGSDEYKKLDAGLRSIVENLNGEVIIIWQGKAYRIQ